MVLLLRQAPMALFLRDEEIRETVGMDDMLEAVEDMQRHYGAGEASNLGRKKITASSGLLSVLGGGLFYKDVFGVKTYTVIAGKYAFQITLYDTTTGRLLAFLQANRLGQLRTGATTGVVVKYLARDKAEVVGILGTGYQAPTQLEAVCKVRTVRRIKAYSKTAKRREQFAQSSSSALHVETIAATSSREAVEGSDIVICMTNSVEPVLDGAWLGSGTLLVGAGPTTLRAREVDDESLNRASRIVVDSLEQAPIEAGSSPARRIEA